jgi:hypothetical protein
VAPLGLRLWRKGGASKVSLAEQMLREAGRRGMRPNGVLFDSWYAASSPFPADNREQGEDIFVHKDGSFYPVAFTAGPIRRGGATVGTNAVKFTPKGGAYRLGWSASTRTSKSR